jgi:hypothetical protein
MQKYRLSFLNDRGQSVSCELVWCASHKEAIQLGSQVNVDFAVEVWSCDNLLATVPKACPSDSAPANSPESPETSPPD